MKQGCLGTIIENNDIHMPVNDDEEAEGVLAVPTVAVCVDENPGIGRREAALTRTNQSMKYIPSLAIAVLSISVNPIWERA